MREARLDGEAQGWDLAPGPHSPELKCFIALLKDLARRRFSLGTMLQLRAKELAGDLARLRSCTANRWNRAKTLRPGLVSSAR